jgi:putative ABC transport system permease protein
MAWASLTLRTRSYLIRPEGYPDRSLAHPISSPTFLAGIVGMIVAVLVSYLIPPMPLYSDIYKTANHEGDILLRASPTIMLVSFGILAAVGIVSGLLPAVRASRMDPVDALRHE